MRQLIVLLAAFSVACAGEGEVAQSGDETIIGDSYVFVDSGYDDDRVDWVVVRAYDVSDETARREDKRVSLDGGPPTIQLPDGTRKQLRGAAVMYYLDGNALEAYPINLRREDLAMVEGETHDSVRALVERLLELSGKRSRG